jgi:hypothetical protein
VACRLKPDFDGCQPSEAELAELIRALAAICRRMSEAAMRDEPGQPKSNPAARTEDEGGADEKTGDGVAARSHRRQEEWRLGGNEADTALSIPVKGRSQRGLDS